LRIQRHINKKGDIQLVLSENAQKVAEKINFSKTALKILSKRYYLKDGNGEPTESSPEELFHRVADFIAGAERLHTEGNYAKYKDVFYEAMIRQEFMPASPVLFNAGTANPMLSSCFALPIKDNMESILKSLVDGAKIFKLGGGVGWNFSKLRAENSPLSSGGISSGVCSFITLFDTMIETVKQGGKRRGAGAVILDVEHPDIEKFMLTKRDHSKWNNMNISVICSDIFMEKVLKGDTDANKIWDMLVESNWESGDPNIVFIDAMNRFNTIPKYPIDSVNPCHEICMSPYESCNLAGINLWKCLKGRKEDKKIDWDRLGRLTKMGHRFLDDMIDVCAYPLPEIEAFAKNTRRQGLYFFGLAPMLIELGLRYGSQESLDLIDNLFCYINRVSLESCIELGKERGNFPDFDDSTFKDKYKYMRCSNRLTIAPSGTTSRIADSYFSIEPYYAFEYESNIMDEKIKEKFQIEDEYKNLYPEALVTAHDISPEDHLRVMAAVGKWIDQSISKTVNLPNSFTKEKVSKILKLAYSMGLKAVAIYRDGSKDIQVLDKQPKTGKEYVIDKEMLEDLYVKQGLSQHGVAELLGVSQPLIGLRMKRYGIPVRIGQGKNISFLPSMDTIKFLHNRSLTYEDISNVFDCSAVTIEEIVKESDDKVGGLLYRHIPISPLLLEFIDGELLGDGCLTLSKKGHMAYYDHASKYYEYLVWLDNIFSSEGLIRMGNIREYIHKENKALWYRYYTVGCVELQIVHDRWYPNGKKTVPKDLKLTPTIVRQWFIGDGSIKKDGSNVRFAVDGFDMESKEILRKELLSVGIDTTFQDDNKTIYVRKVCVKRFYEYMDESFYANAPACYDYKFRELDEPIQCKNGTCDI